MIIALPLIGLSFIFLLIEIFFAGRKNEQKAKRKWTAIVVIVFVISAAAILLPEVNKSGENLFVGSLIVFAGGFLAWLLNTFGHWIISFFAAILSLFQYEMSLKVGRISNKR